MHNEGFTRIRIGTLQTVALNDLTSVTLTPPGEADYLSVIVHQHDAAITYDGTEPTATKGFTLVKDVEHYIPVGLMTTLKVISKSDSPNLDWQAWRTKRDDNT